AQESLDAGDPRQGRYGQGQDKEADRPDACIMSRLLDRIGEKPAGRHRPDEPKSRQRRRCEQRRLYGIKFLPPLYMGLGFHQKYLLKSMPRYSSATSSP